MTKYEGKLQTTRKIYCIEENKIYDSAEQLAKEWDLKYKTIIYNVCNHKKRSDNSYFKSVKDKHLLWLDEYEKCTEEDIQKYLEWCKPNTSRKKCTGLNHPNSKKIICITTYEIFNCIMDAEREKNISSAHISSCCKGKLKSAGKLEDGTKLQWMYYEDYIKQKENIYE